MALSYHRARGQSGRVRLIGRQRGYHGTNFGGTSVGGIPGNRRSFGAQVWGVDHLSHTHRPAAAFSRGVPEVNDDLAAELEGIVELHGAESVAAVIVEPVACSAGVLVPPRGYLQRLREITARHGILLILDEVITAFGRLGTATASDYFGVVPDILSMAKGLTNGSVPMGAVAASAEVYDTIVDNAAPGIEFPHGYTYSGHPLAAAAGLATLEVYRNEDLFARAASLEEYWEDACHSLRDARGVTDIRNIGLIAGIELEPRDAAPGRRAADIFQHCFDAGVLIRATGDTIALSPPLIVSREQIDQIVGRLREAIDAIG
jgi:beta-alanine--pyruvate transaminase